MYEIYNDNGGVVGGMNVRTIMGKATAEKTLYVRVPSGSAFESALSITPQIFDLTAMFGTEIADYIYGLEQANAGDGVAWFRKYFPKPYYAYNAGSLQSVNVASHDLTGFNQFDKDNLSPRIGGYFDSASHTIKAGSSHAIYYIPCLPNTTYFATRKAIATSDRFAIADTDNLPAVGETFNTVHAAPNSQIIGNVMALTHTTGSNAKYLAIWAYWSEGDSQRALDTLCVNLSWSGYRNGEYEEYVKHSYAYDESVQLRGIPQLVDGKLKYDGDTYESSGKVTRKYGIVDLGTLGWYKSGDLFIGPKNVGQGFDPNFPESGSVLAKIFCPKYPTVKTDNQTDKTISGLRGWNGLVVMDSTYSTAADFKTAMSGVYCVYRKTDAEETADPFTNPQIVDDFGTEEYVDAGVKNNTRDVAIPVGHVTQYMANLRDKLQHLPSLASSDGDYIINQTNKDMSLKPLDPYFEKEHPNLVAGSAKQLIATITIEDQTPYTFRTSGGSVDIGDRETDMIVGGTIAWNQLQAIDAPYSGTETINGVTFTRNGDGTFTVSGTATAIASKSVNRFTFLAKHVYIVKGCPSGGGDGTYKFFSTADVNGRVVKYNADDTQYIRIGIGADFTANNLIFKPQIFDLTHMFGNVIADYIYGLETATAGAGAAYFHKLFPKPYYEYNAGELLSVSGLQSHDMVGFNAWDEEWEVGRYDTTTGNPTTSTTQIRCKNFIPVLPNTNYYVKGTSKTGVWIQFYDADKNVLDKAVTDNRYMNASGKSLQYKDRVMSLNSDCHYIRFYLEGTYGTTYTNDICINLSWDGERDGEYEPYEKHSYALDDSLTLRGIPKLDASNNLYYDGDTYESDGTVTRKYGIVDLGTLTWSYKSAGFFSAYIRDFKAPSADRALIYAITNKYLVATVYDFQASPTDKTFTLGRTGFYSECVLIRDSSYTDAAAFKTAMSGIMLVYELATPTTESATPYTNPQNCENGGTEEYVTDSIVPVGHVTQYQPNLRAKLEMAPNSPDGDGDYIVRQTNGTNEYVELVIPKEVPDAPTVDGTYIFKVTVSNGTPTYSWVSE